MNRFFIAAISILVFSSTTIAGELADKIVAVVNTEPILESDFEQLQKSLKQPELLDQTMIQSFGIDKLKSSRTDQLEFLIQDRLIESEIKRLNLSVTDERVNSEIRETAQRNNITADQLLQAIKAQGIPSDTYKSFLKRKIERQSLFEGEIISKLRISDEDALTEYQRKNPNSRTAVHEYTVSHILFNPKKSGGTEAAQKRAEACLDRLKKGESFEALAEQFSEDPNFSAGGLLGSFKTGEFSKELETAVSNIRIGETTGIIVSKMGLHILKLNNKKLTSDSRFEKEKATIRAELLESSFQRQLKSWIQNKRDEAFVKIND